MATTLTSASTPTAPAGFRARLHRQSYNVVALALIGVAVWRLGWTAELPAVIAFIVGGVLLGAIDWKVQRLPTKIVYTTLAALSAGLVFAAVIDSDWRSLGTAVLGGLFYANVFLVISLLATEFSGMKVLGNGDVRLAAVLGVMLGWYGLDYVLYGAIAGHLLALVMIAVMSAKARRFDVRYAFGPPLLAGAYLVILIQP